MANGTLMVRRDADEDIKMRNLEVFVDGERRADLLFGKVYEAPLEAGEHEVMVTNRYKSKKLTLVLSEGETAVFQGANVASGGPAALVGLLGVVVYHVTLKRLE